MRDKNTVSTHKGQGQIQNYLLPYGVDRAMQTERSTLVDAYKKNGVEVVSMNQAQHAAWLEIAKQSSYKHFAEKVPGGKALIDKALAVE